MSRTLILVAEILLVAALCFGIGTYLANKMANKKRARRRLNEHSLPLSAFSTFDHPAANNPADDMPPLEEAEVFMIYGKKAKAIELLRKAMADKRVSRDEYDAFKARHGI
ncbi:MAG: hypothetical protein H6R14_2389 [Proteobacteria bacterium]|nr:hypothetical protein [Pseudomonadota bacterium]